jgi:hypothetical protein
MGAQGAQGPVGSIGPAGPAGPTGPAGAGSNLTYSINTYAGLFAAPADSVVALSANCPSGEVAVSSSCGHYSTAEALDQHYVVVDYSGLNFNTTIHGLNQTQSTNVMGASCLLTNHDTANSQTVVHGVSCLASSSVASTTVAAQVVKSCTYNPDTQSPCTAAEAVPATETSPGVFKAASSQAGSGVATASSPTAAVQSNGAHKATKSVTLWFRE